MIKGIKRRERTFDDIGINFSDLNRENRKNPTGEKLLNNGSQAEKIQVTLKGSIEKVLENEF